jgi:hypothetical protein
MKAKGRRRSRALWQLSAVPEIPPISGALNFLTGRTRSFYFATDALSTYATLPLCVSMPRAEQQQRVAGSLGHGAPLPSGDGTADGTSMEIPRKYHACTQFHPVSPGISIEFPSAFPSCGLAHKPQKEEQTWYGRMTKRKTTLSYNVLKELPNTKAPATLTDESEMRMGVTWTLKMSRYGSKAKTCMTAPMSISRVSITSSLSCRVLARFPLSLYSNQLFQTVIKWARMDA